ncbi:MAG: hypothetical protein ACPL3B_07505 [Fervidobacterium sp.]
MKDKEKEIKRVLEELFLVNAIDFERGVPISSIREEDKEILEECFLRRYVCFEKGNVFISLKGVQYILAEHS